MISIFVKKLLIRKKPKKIFHCTAHFIHCYVNFRESIEIRKLGIMLSSWQHLLGDFRKWARKRTHIMQIWCFCLGTFQIIYSLFLHLAAFNLGYSISSQLNVKYRYFYAGFKFYDSKILVLGEFSIEFWRFYQIHYEFKFFGWLSSI